MKIRIIAFGILAALLLLGGCGAAPNNAAATHDRDFLGGYPMPLEFTPFAEGDPMLAASDFHDSFTFGGYAHFCFGLGGGPVRVAFGRDIDRVVLVIEYGEELFYSYFFTGGELGLVMPFISRVGYEGEYSIYRRALLAIAWGSAYIIRFDGQEIEILEMGPQPNAALNTRRHFPTVEFTPFEEGDPMLEYLDFPDSSAGYAHFDFNGGPSRVAFGVGINHIGEEYGFAIGWDTQVLIEHEGRVHYSYFFAPGTSVGQVMPFESWAEREDERWELRQALLVITSNNIPANNAFLVHFDEQEIEILAMRPQRISMPWESIYEGE